jgi:hypothetical protein
MTARGGTTTGTGGTNGCALGNFAPSARIQCLPFDSQGDVMGAVPVRRGWSLIVVVGLVLCSSSARSSGKLAFHVAMDHSTLPVTTTEAAQVDRLVRQLLQRYTRLE